MERRLSFQECEGIIAPFRCCVGDGRYYVNIFSDLSHFVGNLKNDTQYVPFLPGWQVFAEPQAKAATLVCREAAAVNLQVDAEKHKMQVSAPSDVFGNGRVLAYLALSLIERLRQEDGEFMMHGAAVSKDGKGILLLGDRGDGKTSIALTLCREFGYQLIANDLVVLEHSDKGASILDGTKIIGVRLAAARASFPDIAGMFTRGDERSWTSKKMMYPEDLRITTRSVPCSLDLACMVYIDFSGRDKLSVERLEGSWVRVNLYENLTRYIRGTCMPFIGGPGFSYLGYLPSLDSIECHKKRIIFVEYLLRQKGILGVSGGNLKEVCIHIDSLLSSTK